MAALPKAPLAVVAAAASKPVVLPARALCQHLHYMLRCCLLPKHRCQRQHGVQSSVCHDQEVSMTCSKHPYKIATSYCRSAEEDLRASLFAFDQPPEGRGRGFSRGGRGRGRRY